MNAILTPRSLLRVAWAVLVLSLILWPLSQLTIARDEPPVVLAISWFAITLTAFDVICTSTVNQEVAGPSTCPECPHCQQETEGGGGDA